MPKIDIEDLEKIKEKVKRTKSMREGSGNVKITVHMGTCGIAAGAREIMNVLLDEVERKDADDVLISTSGCAGLCSREPMATVEIAGDPPVKYVDLDKEKMVEILESHALGGEIIRDYALAVGSEKTD